MGKYIPCMWMRGGTSKGGCFLLSDLAQDIAAQNAQLTRIFGANDPSGREVDGMGAGTSTTNKAAIVEKRQGQRNSVNYTFAQVDVTSDLVDRKGNCGNISSIIGPFAIEKGLIEDVTEPVTQVRVFNTNTKKTIVSHVPVKGGEVVYEGDYAIAGVPGVASKIQLDFLDPGGAVTGMLLPTGHVVDVLDVPGYGEFEVSIVDAANPLVFVRAKDVGLSGSELPADVDGNPELLKKLLAIREVASVAAGITRSTEEAQAVPAVPKFCFVAEPVTYKTVEGAVIQKEEFDLQGRMLSMGKLHPTYAITGGVCTGVAAKIAGSIVNQMVSKATAQGDVRIGHCGGLLTVSAQVEQNAQGGFKAVCGTVYRTARVLMRGEVCLS